MAARRDVIGKADVYVGDDLAWSDATVHVRERDLRVKVRENGRSLTPLILRGIEHGDVTKDRGTGDKYRAFTGEDADGMSITVTVVTSGCGCR